jgi:AcrR family transcriptional regulator
MPVFWTHEFSDTSLQDLERATGVNKSRLYTEFRDKEDPVSLAESNGRSLARALADRAVQDVHNLLVREIFIFSQQDNLAKLHWQLLKRNSSLLCLYLAHVKIMRVFGWLAEEFVTGY